jgi:uracil-DNA glycosylase family 4
MNTEPKASFAKCSECPLKDRPFVPSYVPDPSNVNIILIGEAPGQQEVTRGIPFVGDSGKLLGRIFDEIELDGAQIMRTNACLCRPRNNDAPAPAALAACQERLAHELSRYPSAVLVTLGTSATAALDALSGHVTKGRMLQRRGDILDRAIHDPATPASPPVSMQSVATIHPAYVLRAPQNKPLLHADLLKVKRLAANEPIYQFDVDAVRYSVWTRETADRCRAYLERAPANALVAIDTESEHLQWYDGVARPKARLLLLQVAIEADRAILIPYNVLRWRPFRYWFEEWIVNKRTIMHNAKYDMHVLETNDIAMPPVYHDTLIGQYALIENARGQYGLKHLADVYLNTGDYDYEITKMFGNLTKEERNYANLPPDVLYKYGAIDVCATWQLHREQRANPAWHTVDTLFDTILMRYVNVFLRVERNGIPIDVEQLARFKHECAAALDTKQHELRTLAQSYGFVQNPKHKPLTQDSHQQLSHIVYDLLGLKHIKPLGFKTKPRSTNEEALDALPDHAFIRLIKEARRLGKMLNTYVANIEKMLQPNGRISPNFNIHGAETGRFSCNNALHSIPRPEDRLAIELLKCFAARPGRVLIKADYSQAELRVFAAESNEPFFIEAYNRGDDVHHNTALMLGDLGARYAELKRIAQTHDDPQKRDEAANAAKEIRTIAKNVNFGGIVYLGGASGIAQMIPGGKVTKEQIAPLLREYDAKIPVARQYQRDQFAHALKHGYVQTRFGRRRRFGVITDQNAEEVRKASVNAPIQSSAGDLMNLAICELVETYQMCVVFQLHDAVFVETTQEQADHDADLVARVMLDVARRAFPEVAWGCEVEVLPAFYASKQDTILAREYSTLDTQGASDGA